MKNQPEEQHTAARAIATEAGDVLKALYDCPANTFFHDTPCGNQWRGPWLIDRYRELLGIFEAPNYDGLMQQHPHLPSDIGEFAYRCAYFLTRMPAMPLVSDTEPIRMPAGAPDRFPTWLVGKTEY